MKKHKTLKLWLLLLVLVLKVWTSVTQQSQPFRDFPQLFNTAQFKPITTIPSQSTCGVPSRSAYCRSSTFSESITRCKQDFCVQDCPRRTSMPSFVNLLSSQDYGRCVYADTVNTRPNTSPGDSSSVFTNGPLCYLTPDQTPVLGSNGVLSSFTLAGWIWQNAGDAGTIFHKTISSSGDTVLQVQVQSDAVVVKYLTQNGLQTTTLVDTIPEETWTHLAIQVYGTAISFFLNGLGPGFTATATQTLAAQPRDTTQTSVTRVGQATDGTDQFEGRLQDFRFYSEELSNREIALLYSGSLPKVHLQTDCRCPLSHPRVKPQRSRYCIKNGVPDNTGDEIERLSNLSHPLEYLNDGDTNSIWVSSFLDDVFITIDLQDQFQVFYVVLQFYSPLPKVVTIERKRNASSPWERWQLYAEDCQIAFSMPNNGALDSPTSINCLQFGTSSLAVPYSKGNITFNVLSPEPARPGHNDFYGTPALFGFVEASHVRVRLQDHYYVTQARHRYYGLYEYVVSARCNCHGHATDCDVSQSPYKCNCLEDSHTMGNKCEVCKPLYNDKPFRDGDQVEAYNCKPCQCYGHADSCVYNTTLDPFPDLTDHNRGGGGVCVNCAHNTAGQNCDKCKQNYYRPVGKSLYEIDVCTTCDCNMTGVVNGNTDCDTNGGQCYCKANVTGRQCDRCKVGFYNLQDSNPVGCDGCGCNTPGTVNGDPSCHETSGQCTCKQHVRNLKCDACQFGYYNLTSVNPKGCSPCNCDPLGSTSEFCNPDTGQCQCKPNVVGLRCDKCEDGYYDFNGGCKACNCDPLGTAPGSVCNKNTGQCLCKANTEGRKCDQCKNGFYSFGGSQLLGCIPCTCDAAGTLNGSQICNKRDGTCACKSNVVGQSCNQCAGNTWGLNITNPAGCQPCGCDPTGTQQGDQLPPNQLTCNQNTGQCTCLQNRIGRICDTCIPGYYYNNVDGGGCLDCDCHNQGAIRGTFCDRMTGQCQCKQGGSGVGGRQCDTCLPKYFDFDAGSGSCKPCRCNPAGSVNDTCHPVSGACDCKPFVREDKCDQCVPGSSYLEAENPYGCSKNPNQQPPPTHAILSPTAFKIMWDAPDYPNGIILTYFLYRDGNELIALDPNVFEYNDTGLAPFMNYTYEVKAVNRYGSVMSPSVTFRTPSGTPEGNITLLITSVITTSATLSWNRPAITNGPIIHYIVESVTPSRLTPKVHWRGLGLSVVINDLSPFTNYTFTVKACTSGGCLTSFPNFAITTQGPPMRQGDPVVMALNTTSFYIEWDPPAEPNGIIIFYELWMRGILKPDGTRTPTIRRIYHPAGQYNPRPTTSPQENALPPPATNFTVAGLEPYTQYEFQVLSQNDAGKAASSWVVARTLEAIPLSTPTPVVKAVSSSSLNISWDAPHILQARGEIIRYYVYQKKATDLTVDPFAPPFYYEAVATNNANERSYLLTGLKPYTDEEIMIGTCNSVGCVNSSAVVTRTKMAPPEGQGAPDVEGYNSTVMGIKWDPPEKLNGPQPYYVIERMSAAFNYPPPKVIRGTRFPGGGYYKFPADSLPQGVGFTGIEIEFKTTQKDGLLFFAASEGQQEEFIALQLSKGRPWFLFDPQGCTNFMSIDPNVDGNRNYSDGQWHHLLVRRDGQTATMTLDEFEGCSAIVTTTDDEGLPYNNGQWHTVRVIRDGKFGTIELDGRWTGRRTSTCATGNIIGSNTGVYIGGLPPEFQIKRPETDWRARVVDQSFQGCVRDIRFLIRQTPTPEWKLLDWDLAVDKNDAFPTWEGCPMNVQQGIHFLGQGYIAVPVEEFSPNEDTSYTELLVEFKMRTENQNGLIFFAYGGTGIYVYMQLVNSNLHFTFKNTGLKIQLIYTADTINICDGKWHEIQFMKNQSKLSVMIDGGELKSTGSSDIAAPLDVYGDLFIGGIPPNSEAQKYVEENNLMNELKDSFGGCMKDFRIDDWRRLKLLEKMTSVLNVNLDGCPLTQESGQTCIKTQSEVVYNSTGNLVYDDGRKIFTGFSGCLDIYEGGKPIERNNRSYHLNINLDGCPPTLSTTDSERCVNSSMDIIYTGNEFEVFDTSREVFTEYLYRVHAINEAGSAKSPWGYGRTKDGPPFGLSAPYGVVAPSGYVINARWRHPTGHTGLLTKYLLRAYDYMDKSATPVEAEFPVTKLRGGITTAIPNTHYTLVFVACTAGGCSESEGVNITTQEEVPEQIATPVAESGHSWLYVQWSRPLRPNGVITGYFLYQEIGGAFSEVYRGNRLEFNVTGLQVYTAYQFYIQACTKVGCASGPTATLTTAQLPPTRVEKPTLTVLGTKRIRVDWTVPSQLNGVLERYMLYVSTEQSSIDSVMYNSSDLFMYYTLTDLIPGTKYFIRVSACTAGGCRLGIPANATTEESAPEGIPDPVVISPSPTELNISWTEPALPNGIILYNELYQNGLMVFNHSRIMEFYVHSLRPWSLHKFRVRACTAKGCGSSNEVAVRTQEDKPVGQVVLEMAEKTARSVELKWTAPATPNGLLNYSVYFDGLFYANPADWNYNVVRDRRWLYTTLDADIWVTIDNLIPYSQYRIDVNASNTKGFILSNELLVDMPMGSPDGVKPPTLSTPSSTSIRATWSPVGRANADNQPSFQLQFREPTPGYIVQDLFPNPTTATTYLKTNLQPYTEYEFRLIAMNSIASTMTEWVSIYTRQDKPGSIDPPMTASILPRSMDVFWEEPLVTNGIIKEYRVYQNNVLRVTVQGNVTRIKADNLIPYTSYVFKVEACTVAGCTMSAESQPVRTYTAAPEGIQAPTLISETPTSVLVEWDIPDFPNGIISGYTLERRLTGDSDTIVTVVHKDPGENTRYVDESVDLKPYTSYEYRVLASTATSPMQGYGGVGYGPWAEVTTKASRPSPMRPPVVEVLSPTAVKVTWKPPFNANGRLETYTIKFPIPRIELRNTSILSINVTDLLPYTQYSVTVTACTDGGCTESTPTVIRTFPTYPQDQQPPTATPISQTFISVIWQPPLRQNGPNLRYELGRKKLRQPLEVNPTNVDLWQNIYSGTGTSFDDRGLTLFTTYVYRVTAYNDYGHDISDDSALVTTFGGVPQAPAVLMATAVSHLVIRLNWTTPDEVILQGMVDRFRVQVWSLPHNFTRNYDPGTNTTDIGGLSPNTNYMFYMRLYINGGAFIDSTPVGARTLDGAPEGLQPPDLFAVSDTSLRVVWMAPAQPNGRILAYNIYLDGQKIPTNLTTAGSYLLRQLIPYTVYRVQIEVCTIFACLKSDIAEGTTAEAVPQQVTKPNLNVLAPYSIEVTWPQPGRPNGIIQRYDLLRKAVLPCKLRPQPTMDPPNEKCTYIQCGILEGMCGTQCYTGPKTCCDGTLHGNQQGYECCGKDYIPQRVQADDVCCGGKFYTRQDNYECCGGRYVKVLPGQICCPDANEDRVDIGFGDSCCGSTPYMASGAQLCCNDKLYDKFGRQCCGGEVVGDHMVCCGNTTFGNVYAPTSGNTCCGTEYVVGRLTSCCVDATGKAKSHMYSSASAKINSNQKCCGVERISNTLSCCNNVGYNPMNQVCGDRSSMDSDCGSSTVCPASQSFSAFCDRCDFNRNAHICGSVPGHYDPTPTPEPTPLPDKCVDGPIKIYTGLSFRFTDTNLYPFTRYEYSIIAVNKAGSKASDYSVATTSQAKPEGVVPPTTRIEPTQLDTIYLTWQVPQMPNGEIIRYILLRSGIEIYRGLGMQYMDNNNIKPYQTYSYILRVCTIEGCTDSDTVDVATLEALPEQLYSPSVVAINSTALEINWQPPAKPNGIVTRYSLVQEGVGTIFNTTMDVRRYILGGLKPYGKYSFYLVVCTGAGCVNSTTVSKRTREAVPKGVATPKYVILSSTSVILVWTEPQEANGLITMYKLYRGNSVVYTGDGSTFMHTDVNLVPGNSYGYKLEAMNSAGGTNSSVRVILMPTLTPEGIPAPHNVTALDANSIYVEWRPPSAPNGAVDQYRVLLNGGTAKEIERGVGPATSALVKSLEPYTKYSVRIRACLQGVTNGCGTGPAVEVWTKEAPPVGLAKPTLTPRGPSVVDVEWTEPLRPNGVITEYRIYRRVYTTTQELIINIIKVENGTQLMFTNAGPELTPFTEYEYKILAVNSAGQTISPWSRVRTLEAAPVGMQAPTVTTNSAYSLHVSWSAPSKPNGVITVYQIQYRGTSDDPTIQFPISVVTVPGDVYNTSFSGLKPYATYEVRVLVLNSAGNAASQWVRGTTQQASPSEVGNFTVEKVQDGRSVILRWEEPGETNGVIMEYRIYEQDGPNPIYRGLNREFEFRRLSPYTSYGVQLEACTDAGCAKSSVQTFTTAEIAPQNQAPPTFGGSNATSIVVKWNPPVNAYGKITLFEVMRRTVGAIVRRAVRDPVVVYSTQDTDQTDYEYVDTGLTPYTTYEYKIQSTNSKGTAESPWLEASTDQAAPEGLTAPNVEYVANTAESLKITWLPPARANGIIQSYQLRRNDSTPWSFSADAPKEYVDQNLKAFTVYSYTITVCTAGGCSTSPPGIRSTRETAPLFVSSPVVNAVNSSALKLTWTSPQITNGQILSYTLMMDNNPVYTGLNLEHTVVNLIPYQEYTFMLRACTSGGCTDSSATTGRPSESGPTGMRAPALRVMSSNAIEITWQEPDHPNGIITAYELRRDGTLIYSGPSLFYTDYGLEPGVEYSYAVTAINSQGSTTSSFTKATTYSSSPEGLLPPTLTPVSSTEIQATWQAPAKPNGIIYNYTLYRDDHIEFSGTGFSYKVPGLDYWSWYSFRVQACTNSGCVTSSSARSRTLEGPPIGQSPPSLFPQADQTGKHSGIRAEWLQPSRPNGVILQYELFRRTFSTNVVGQAAVFGPSKRVYNGTALFYEDNDRALSPYTEYQYKVTAHNAVDRVSSMWVTVRTFEAPPEKVPPPTIETSSLTATSFTVRIQVPVLPNGQINSLIYNVIVNDTGIVKSKILLQTVSDRRPYTMYSVKIEACNSAGCTTSNTTYVRTKQAQPLGLAPPVITDITDKSAKVTWSPPDEPNGVIRRYDLKFRQQCPGPYQPFNDTDCRVKETEIVYSGMGLTYVKSGLEPYKYYQFQIGTYNDFSIGAESTWQRIETKSAAPVYLSPPRLSKKGTAVVVDWSTCFRLNGELLQYELTADNLKTYTGFDLQAAVERVTKEQTIEFKVRCITRVGYVDTPAIVFDPTSPDNIATEPPTAQPQVDLAFYQEVWFIAVVALVALLLLLGGIGLCLRCSTSKSPYVRERMPLQPRQKKYAEMGYCVDPYDGSIITNDIPQASSQPGSLRGRPTHLYDNSYVNPVYSTGASARSHSDVLDFSFDKFSTGKSSKYLDDDEEPVWDGHIPNDSGLHSMAGAYDDDYDDHSSHPVSVTKEQTVFTDTHL